MPFFPIRLQIARQRRSLLQRELAERCGVSPQSISNWEKGAFSPGKVDARRLAMVLDFPEEFFQKPSLDRLPPGAASFRARTKLSARNRDAALAAGDLARELASWIEERFDLPNVSLPELVGVRPNVAAQILRTEWLIGDKPIANMICLLESKGVLVFSLAEDCRDLDAFSFWSGSRPIVLLNTMKSGERSRFDAAHELFHLVAHREETGREEERDADSFAGAFLMPDGDVFKYLPRVLSLPQLVQAKARWRVALSALVFRLHALGIASDWQYRTLCIELSKRGYRSSEPAPIKREGSSLLGQVFEDLRESGQTPRRVADELGWPVDELRQLIFGLGATMIDIPGSGARSAPRAGHLKLVEGPFTSSS